MRLDENNGITMCEHHHRGFHDIYGRRNFGGIDFLDYLSRKGVWS